MKDLTLTRELAFEKRQPDHLPEERIAKRLAICSTCDHVATPDNESARCWVCGCTRYGEKLSNLVLFEETRKYGCKHPDGSKWQAEGV